MSNREFARGPPSARMNSNFGHRSRYVPPQMRRQTLDNPVRPESSMSNMSFGTCGPGDMGGGVSLRGSGGGFDGYNMMPQNGVNSVDAYPNMGQAITADVGYPMSVGKMPFVGGSNFDTGYNAPVYNFAIQQPVPVSSLHLNDHSQTDNMLLQRPAFFDPGTFGMTPSRGRPRYEARNPLCLRAHD